MAFVDFILTFAGTDLSPIQPGWVPPNCFFEVDDYESEWDFSKPFDFIHGRALAGTVKDFPTLYGRIKNNLRAGGWVEMVEIAGSIFSDDDTMKDAPNLSEWARLQNEASVKFGKKFDVAHEHKDMMVKAGFMNVREEVKKIPLNPWPKHRKLKELGRYQQVNAIESMESYSMALLTRILGWDPDDVNVFFAGVRQELANRSLHTYAKFHFVYGQKEE
ncbi:Methyltransferase [Aspergillus sp. HF37]|nr:Methyltransferase [Aspergillus sp. HF37]